MLKIVEVSNTIHGELPHLGAPCRIIRLAQCNLRCAYCDAEFINNSWEVTHAEFQRAITDSPHKHILITGGEPLLQGFELAEALAVISARGKHVVTLETNGTVLLTEEILTRVDHVVMDVKLFRDSFAIERRNLKTIALDPRHAVKFVLTKDDDWFLAWEFVKKLPANFAPMIIFSPTTEYRTSPYMDAFQAYAAVYPSFNLRLQVQIHKLLGVA